jgi:hypothetical protein
LLVVLLSSIRYIDEVQSNGCTKWQIKPAMKL